jgi:SPP1 family predicted phage head-tail adaptor
MDRRVTFQTFTEAQNSFGEPVKTWANLVTSPTVWAKVEDIAGSRFAERYAAGKVQGVIDTRFTVRYRSDLSVEMRVVHEDRNYDIRSLVEIGRRVGLEILATAVAE